MVCLNNESVKSGIKNSIVASKCAFHGKQLDYLALCYELCSINKYQIQKTWKQKIKDTKIRRDKLEIK